MNTPNLVQDSSQYPSQSPSQYQSQYQSQSPDQDQNATQQSQKNSKTPHPLLMAGSIISFWAEAADTLLKEDNNDCALLYIHILRKGHDSPEGWTETRKLNAQLKLRELGLYSPDQCVNPSPQQQPKTLQVTAPVYSTADVNIRLSDTKSTFRELVNQIEQRLNKQLTQPDLKILLGIQDHLGFSFDVILLLTTFVIARHKDKFGQNSLPTIKIIQKEANYWSAAGVADIQSAEEFILRKQDEDQWESRLEALLHLPYKSISGKAKSYSDVWKTWNFSDEIYSYLYEVTTYNLNKWSWAYANTILEKWHVHGFTTVEDIKLKDKQVGKRPGQKNTAKGRPQNGPKHSAKTQDFSPQQEASLQAERRANLEQLRRMVENNGNSGEIHNPNAT